MKLNVVLPALALLALSACATNKPTSAAPETLPNITGEVPLPVARPSMATVSGPKGKITGLLTFKDEGKKIRVIGEFNGLKPNTEHGLHVHENADCKPPKFESAGGHWNPQKTEHGGPEDKMRHPGDLGNVMSDANGKAVIDRQIPAGVGVGTFSGKSIILHSKRDDLKTQPTGDAGDRIACGLIKEVQ